jgi:predicted MFS family arabinose efflux permease
VALVSLILLSILAHTAFAGSRVAVSLAALGQGASPLVVGILLTLFAAVPMFLSLASGRLVDRVGVRWPLALALLALAVSLVTPTQSGSLLALAVVAAGAGTSFLFIHIAVQHAVGQLADAHDRSAQYSWLALGFSISSFLGPVVTGLGIDRFGFAQSFALLAALPLAALLPLILTWRALPNPTTLHARSDDDSVWDLLTDSGLRRVFVAMAILATAWDLYIFAIPVYGSIIGLTATTIGLIMGAFAVATFVVRLALPWLAPRADPWKVIFTAMVVAGVAYLLFPLTRSAVMLGALTFLLGLGLGSTQPMVLTLIHEGAPFGRQGEALGLRATIVNTSSTVLPLAFGATGLALGVGLVFVAMAMMLGGGAFYAQRFWRRW